MPVWTMLGLFLLAINAAAFICFGLDKRRARSSGRRLRERTLLGLALFGGIGGAYLGRRAFQHKTRKTGFSIALLLIALAQVAGLAWLFMQA